MFLKNNINDNWKFTKKTIDIEQYDSSKFEQVNLPHTWNGYDGQDGGDDYYRGKCYYEKIINIEKENKKNYYIEFEGANSVCNVYLNNIHIGEHKGGYSIFRVDITKHVKTGQNILLVCVDNSHNEEIYPLMADFTFFGGLYRGVNLITVDEVLFDLDDNGSQGIYISQTNVTKQKATLEIKSLISNRSDKKNISLNISIIDKEKKAVVTTTKNIILKENAVSTDISTVIIDNPILWDSTKNPYLYKVIITLNSNDETIDKREINTGLRYYHFDSEKGFFLNGKHLKLKGVSRHQDRINIGWALGEKEKDEDMAIIKELGVNSIRLAHYQHDQYFYDLCDKEGMLIWAEIPYITMTSDIDAKGVNAKSQLVELIKQNYNHSSIFTWGVQNEITIGGNRKYVDSIVSELNTLAKQLDSTRATTQAQVGQCEDSDHINSITDILAYNKYYGWYYDNVEKFESWISQFRETNPNISLGISEYGAEGILNYQNINPKVGDYSETYQALYHEKAIQIFNSFDSIWGSYVWNMFDFASDMRDEGGTKGRNNKGLVTYDRKIKKDSFYIYKAYWSDEKFVHLTGKRYQLRSEKFTTFKVYSNLSPLTLYHNNKKIETIHSDNKVFLFKNIKLNRQNYIRIEGMDNDKVIIDEGIFKKVIKQKKQYIMSKDAKNTTKMFKADEKVSNWFDDVVIKPLEITDDVYSTKVRISELMENEEAKAVVMKYLEEMTKHPMFKMAAKMSIDQIAEMKSDLFSDKLMYVLNKELIKIKRD